MTKSQSVSEKIRKEVSMKEINAILEIIGTEAKNIDFSSEDVDKKIKDLSNKVYAHLLTSKAPISDYTAIFANVIQVTSYIQQSINRFIDGAKEDILNEVMEVKNPDNKLTDAHSATLGELQMKLSELKNGKEK